MDDFRFEELYISGAYKIESYIFEDNRGNFIKSFEKEIFQKNGITFNCSEDFISKSSKNVIRGMHFQLYHPQIKIVSVIQGKVFDVIVDLRKDSKSFGKWQGVYLSSENRNSLLIPRGCAHGFMSLSDDSIVSYKCDGAYDKKTDMGILYSDEDIAVEWPIRNLNEAIVGKRDLNQMSFKEFAEKYDFIY